MDLLFPFIILALIFIFFSVVPIPLWITATFSGVRVPLGSLVAMRLRRTRPEEIVYPLILATKAGVEGNLEALYKHHLAGGHPLKVIQALVIAKKTHINLSFDHAAAIDLAGRDVLEEVREATTEA